MRDRRRHDGLEAIRRLELEERPDKKAAIDRVWGQTKERAAAHGFARNVPPDTIAGPDGAELPHPLAYPDVDGTLPALVDGLRDLRREVAELRGAVAAARGDDELRREVEELKLRPFG